MSEQKTPQEPKEEDSTEFNRAPRQKPEHRDPVNSAETTKDIPTQHGVIK